MRFALPLLLAAGCSIDPEKFAEEFVPAYCEVWDECNTSGQPCPVSLDSTDFSSADCEFDKEAARECLAADYGCNEQVPGFEVVETPDACLADRLCGL